MFSKAMMAALEADGEKLRQLTGDDHGPVFLADAPEAWKDCEVCGGDGVIYKTAQVFEPGCGFAHDDVASVECDACSGNGGFLCEAEPDRPHCPQDSITERQNG